MEYSRRVDDGDPTFGDDEKRDLEWDIIDASRVMSKKGLQYLDVIERVQRYLGAEWKLVDSGLARKLIAKGVNEHLMSVLPVG